MPATQHRAPFRHAIFMTASVMSFAFVPPTAQHSLGAA
jgi:hypothetical protein